MSKKLLDLKAVTAKTALSRSTIYLMISTGRFPAPLQVMPRTVRWREATVDAWIDSLKPTVEPPKH